MEQFINYIRNSKAIKITLLALILIAGVFTTLYFDLDAVKEFIRENPGQTILISLVIYFLLGFTFIPSSPLTLFIAVFIGPLQAALISILGNTLAALLEYQIGKSVGEVVNFEEKKSKLPFGLADLPVKSPLFLLIGRILPAGTRGLSILSGAYSVPMNLYLWTTVSMYTISGFFIAFTGENLVNMFVKTAEVVLKVGL